MSVGESTTDEECVVSATLMQVAKHGTEVILQSRVAGETIRQCSCEEQSECGKEMRAQAKECAGPCFAEFRAITERPNDLKKCFEEKDNILQGFLICFEQKMESCVPHKNGPQIPKTDVNTLFSISEHRIVNQSVALQSVIAPIKHIMKAAGEFAKCIKNCFLAKNANGFCFDRRNCQPLVAERKTKASIRHCTRQVNWKKEAGEFCECTVNAGVR
uniref:CPG4 domain-containing protein n=1 Tax=Angiostrongylus cantonensis TaxID=6313 RepID=A0A0K0DME1_ANGCA